MIHKIRIVLSLSFLAYSCGINSQQTENKIPTYIIINGQKLSVIDHFNLKTRKGEFRFLYGTRDTAMIDCPNEFGLVIEDLKNKRLILNEGWGINGTSPDYNIFAKPKYAYNSSIGEKIYVNLGISGCGSGFTYTTFELTGFESGTPRLRSCFKWSETSRIVYDQNSGMIYLMTGLWEMGCHFGCKTRYDVQIFSMKDRTLLKRFKTKRKYPDATSDVSDEKILQLIMLLEG
ncbi:MAG: hypothetical protein ACKO6Q_01600 [Bacteroidota bacterium]